jgi:hypothetical protein
MTDLAFSMRYDTRTSISNTASGSALSFATNTQRAPVSFRGQVNEPVLLRQLMYALQDVILGDYRQTQPPAWLLDPVITVHPDEMCFEAFSTDGSIYGRLSAASSAFTPSAPTTYGTTNIDFTFDLRDALSELRSSRHTEFTVGAGGFGVNTEVGGQSKTHYENKVTLPASWVKGFLQVQGALTMKAFTFDVRPVDLLTVIAYMIDNPEGGSANGMRYDFRAGEAISIMLEPHPYRFMLKGTSYAGYARVVRVWGRKRLDLLMRVLPYADKVTIGVVGRGMPHYYICHCGPYKFTLVLSGWARNDWAEGSAFDLLAPRRPTHLEQVAQVYNFLGARYAATRAEIAAHTLIEGAEAEGILFELTRAGRSIYDPVSKQYRLRELFQTPIDMNTLFAPNPRLLQGEAIFEAGGVTLLTMGPSDVRKDEVKATALVQTTEQVYNVVVALDSDHRIKFAQCTCRFFQDNIMSRGPCEHILAAQTAFTGWLEAQAAAGISVWPQPATADTSNS